MWNPPTKKQLDRIPPLYATEKTKVEDKLIHMHFFIGGCDWYATEYDPEDRVFFGFAILNGDMQNAEWGYFSLDELESVKIPPGIEIDRDCYWTVRPAREVDKIAEAQGWLRMRKDGGEQYEIRHA